MIEYKSVKMKREGIYLLLLCWILMSGACAQKHKSYQMNALQVSDNGRFLTKGSGKPFFWLGETAWLLFTKLNREEAIRYLDNRKDKGFTVIQAIVVPSVSSTNAYGDSIFINQNFTQPAVTSGHAFNDSLAYDYWDHIDFVIKEAAKRGIYMALVPIWGGNVLSGKVNQQEAHQFAGFLADRYKKDSNIVWINGGDVYGSDSIAVWNSIGQTLNRKDPNHLITFHPRGRMMSSMWFHDQPWLDFNMFQSGHRRYDQDSTKLNFGEDNWRYVRLDYNKTPVKPTLDGEPSYEGIPQGLHDTTQPRWQASDLRRYGYWSVFAGACGFTYGDNAVWQMHTPSDQGAFGVRQNWYDALNDSGAIQVQYLKKLMLSYPYFSRVPDSTLVANQGLRYNHLAATRGKKYAMVYTYNGRVMKINMGKISGEKVKASWYSPRDGSKNVIGEFPNSGEQSFDPPGEKTDGNDWVLLLESE